MCPLTVRNNVIVPTRVTASLPLSTNGDSKYIAQPAWKEGEPVACMHACGAEQGIFGAAGMMKRATCAAHTGVP